MTNPFQNYDAWLTNLPAEEDTWDYTYFNSKQTLEAAHSLYMVAKREKRIDKDYLVGVVMAVLDCLDCDTYERLKDQMY